MKVCSSELIVCSSDVEVKLILKCVGVTLTFTECVRVSWKYVRVCSSEDEVSGTGVS